MSSRCSNDGQMEGPKNIHQYLDPYVIHMDKTNLSFSLIMIYISVNAHISLQAALRLFLFFFLHMPWYEECNIYQSKHENNENKICKQDTYHHKAENT